MSAEEIRTRLEAPVTFETGPVRLPVALDELGNMVGVRIRCDSELQPAVVAVFAKAQPAKEVLKRLLDGISAGSSIYQGTLQVGMGIVSPDLEEKRAAGAKASIQQWIDNRGKTAQIDKPLDPAYFARLGALALMATDILDSSTSVRTLRIGILGFGTVGTGAYRMLHDDGYRGSSLPDRRRLPRSGHDGHIDPGAHELIDEVGQILGMTTAPQSIER